MDLNADLSGPKSDARLGRHPLPSPAHWQTVLERLGIRPEHEVVIYDQADGAMAAARAWFLFVLAGHENVTVLNGGMNAWLALDLPTGSVIAEPEFSHYPVHFRMQRLIAEAELKIRIRDPDALLLDARAPERFRGELEPLDRKAGHIPGAVNRSYAQNLENGLFKSPDTLRAEFEALADSRKEMLLSCGSGVTACHNALALSHAGLDHWRHPVHPAIGIGALLRVGRPERAGAMPGRQVAHHRIGFPQHEAIVIDGGHPCIRIHAQVLRRVHHPMFHAGLGTAIGHGHFFERPHHLLHIDGIGASPEFEHVQSLDQRGFVVAWTARNLHQASPFGPKFSRR